MAYIDYADEIFIEPPENHVLTDEDSGDEDGAGTLDNLTGRQLRSNVEIKFLDSRRISTKLESNSPTCSKSNTQTVTNTGSSKEGREFAMPDKKSDRKDDVQWITNGDLINNNSRSFTASNYSQYCEMTCLQIFEQFIDDDIINLLVSESSKYAAFKNCPDPHITTQEMKCFIAILIVSGYDVKPSKRHYWDSAGDMKNISVSEAMRRDRFVQILRFIHCADNSKIDMSDKMYKLRPLMNKLKNNFQKNFVAVEQMDFDESMIKYFGRHGCKQCIRGKPIRFGFKMWSLNSPDGYLVNFDVYQGRNPNAVPEYEYMFGKNAAPFVSMLKELPNPELPYKFYLDNLFTSISLFNFLRSNGYGATGTFREDRLARNCPLEEKKSLKKANRRGTFVSAIDQTHGILFVKWTDNNIVTVGSTCHGVYPTSNVKRYSQAEKKFIQVTRPHVVGEYNKNMGGTDLMDQNISAYRIGIRSKKWWWSIFTWLLDAAINNSWIIYKKNNIGMSQLDFRRSIAQAYLKIYQNPPKSSGRISVSKSSISLNRISDDVRYDGKNHLLILIPDKKRRRCAGEGCSSSTRTMCKKCDVGICLECNVIFHTKTHSIRPNLDMY